MLVVSWQLSQCIPKVSSDSQKGVRSDVGVGDTWLLKRLGQPKITLPLDLQPSIISPLSGVLIGQTAARSARALQFTRSSGGDIAFLIYRDIHLFCCRVLCLRQVSHCSSGWLGTHSCSLEFAAILPWSPTDVSHHIHPVTPRDIAGVISDGFHADARHSCFYLCTYSLIQHMVCQALSEVAFLSAYVYNLRALL